MSKSHQRPPHIPDAPTSYRDTSALTKPSRPAEKTAEKSGKPAILQDPFLNQLRREHVPVSIYLVNGIKLQGRIESFDPYVVLLHNTVTQMVYKHAISTIVPSKDVNFSAVGGDSD